MKRYYTIIEYGDLCSVLYKFKKISHRKLKKTLYERRLFIEGKKLPICVSDLLSSVILEKTKLEYCNYSAEHIKDKNGLYLKRWTKHQYNREFPGTVIFIDEEINPIMCFDSDNDAKLWFEMEHNL